MKKACAADRPVIIELLARSFQHNLSVNYIVKNDNRKFARIRSLMEYSVDVCSLFGEVLISEDRKGCVLIFYPQFKKTSLKSIWLDLKLVFNTIGAAGLFRTLKRENLIMGIRGKEPMLKAQRLGLPVYLETSTQRNLPWYEKLGFEIYNEAQLNYSLFFLRYIDSFPS